MTDDKPTENEAKAPQDKGFWRLALPRLIGLVLFLGYLFWLARRLDYWQGLVFGGSVVIISIVALILFSSRPDLARERLKPGPGVKWWDKFFFAVYGPAFGAIMIVGVLDAAYYHFARPLSPVVYAFGLLIYAAGNFLVFWAMAANRFFSTAVRIQRERGHTVVTGGPYRFVRHPGYVGAILLAGGMALVLGSRWALLPAGVVALSVIVRTWLEDNTLQAELEGYADYAEKVKSRLLPGVW